MPPFARWPRLSEWMACAGVDLQLADEKIRSRHRLEQNLELQGAGIYRQWPYFLGVTVTSILLSWNPVSQDAHDFEIFRAMILWQQILNYCCAQNGNLELKQALENSPGMPMEICHPLGQSWAASSKDLCTTVALSVCLASSRIVLVHKMSKWRCIVSVH